VVDAVNRSPDRLEAREQATGQVKWSLSPQAPTETNSSRRDCVTRTCGPQHHPTVYRFDLARTGGVTYPKPARLALSF